MTEEVDGFVGLSHSDPQFLLAIENKNWIKKPIFSFYVEQEGESSHIDIGEPQKSKVKGKKTSNIKYFDVNKNDTFWSAYN